ncbi:MAG: hypothetical protein CVU98_06170 [Firmicutes bacterium HGW-Firmicutes-3]|jgi:hypothetical protein|nr:MAG: hypothetical protein CVU98_06170 [Firmicutes bacterium HGW-Firmicutes-3]
MRKIIAVLVLIGLGALLFLNPSIYNKNKEEETKRLFDDVIEEKEILPLAQANTGILTFNVEKLQKSPYEIIKFNTMLMKVMYSGKLSEEEVMLLAKVQRTYYAEALLEQNPEEEHMASIVEEVRRANEGKDHIVDYRILLPEYSPTDNTLAFVKVVFIPNSVGKSENIQQQYVLERLDGLWFIKGWVPIDDTITIE